MNTTILALFDTQESAENAINELCRNSFLLKDISIVMKDQSITKEVAKNIGTQVKQDMLIGIAAGGILGGVAGLLVGIGAIVIPGIGGILIAGPIAAALGLTGASASTTSGVLIGALGGGLLGGFIGLGLPMVKARIYETDIKTGAILLGVPTSDVSENIVKQIFQKHHANHIRSVKRGSVQD